MGNVIVWPSIFFLSNLLLWMTIASMEEQKDNHVDTFWTIEHLKKIFTIIGATIAICFTVFGAFYMYVYGNMVEMKNAEIALLERQIEELKKQTTQEPITQQQSDYIYQNGEIVGDVTGKIEITSDTVLFEELSETSKLNRNLPFQYMNQAFIITSIEKFTALKLINASQGSGTKQAILYNVTCKKL